MDDQFYNEIFNKIKYLGIDFLENTNLLENTIKELYISKLIENIKVDDKKFEIFLKDFLKKNGLKDEKCMTDFLLKNNFSEKIFQTKIKRSFKIQTFFLNEFKELAKDVFLNNKSSYDKVTYALIRTNNFKLAKELYLQIEAKEENIYNLSEKYSQGEEKFSKGIIGPIPLNQSHKIIRQKINSLKGEELFEPFKVDNWWVILKLEKVFIANYSNSIEIKICRDLFEKKVLKTSMSIIKEVRNLSVSERKQGSNF